MDCKATLQWFEKTPETKRGKWCTVPMITSSSSMIVPLKSTPSNPTARSSSSAAPMAPFESMVQIPLVPTGLRRPISTRCERSPTLWREPLKGFQRRLSFQCKYCNRESYSYLSLSRSLFIGSRTWKPLLWSPKLKALMSTLGTTVEASSALLGKRESVFSGTMVISLNFSFCLFFFCNQ